MSTHPNNPKKNFTHWTRKKKFRLEQPGSMEDGFNPPKNYGLVKEPGKKPRFKRKDEI